MGKLTNATVVYRLCPSMLQSIKNVISVWQIMRYKVLQFWAKLDTNYRFTLKKGIFFWKNILMLILTTSCTLSKYYNVQKKLIKVDHKIQGCIIFGQIGLGYFFGGKLTIVTFVNLLHPIILKSLN